MPFNFLELLPSRPGDKAYKKVRQRRNIVAGYANESYHFETQEDKKKAIQEIESKGIKPCTSQRINADMNMFAKGFEFLNGADERKQELRDAVQSIINQTSEGKRPNIPVGLYGVYSLMRDKIETWDQILELKREHDEQESIPEESPQEDVSLQESEEEEEAIDLKTLAQDAAEFLPEIAQSFASIIPRLLEEIEKRDRKISLLSSQSKSLNQQAKSLLENLEKAQNRADEWEQYALELDAKEKKSSLEEVRKYAENEGAGTRHGERFLREFNLFEQAQKMAEQESSANGPPDGFPESMQAGNMSGYEFIYERSFLDDLKKRSEEDKERAQQALQKFSLHGEHYPSLHTHAISDDYIICLPKGCSSSHASDELRFFWKHENEKIHFYRLGRKGEKWLQASEA